MKPVRSLDDDLSDIRDLCEWKKFEDTDLGNLTIINPERFWPESDQPYSYDCYLRVGLHMGQPTEAVMSCGRFIKMRKYNGDTQFFTLSKLDPRKPQDSLYGFTDFGYSTGFSTPVFPPTGYTLQGIPLQTTMAPPAVTTRFHWNPAVAYQHMSSQWGALNVPNIYPQQTIAAGYAQYAQAAYAQTTMPAATTTIPAPIQTWTGLQSQTSDTPSFLGSIGNTLTGYWPFR